MLLSNRFEINNYFLYSIAYNDELELIPDIGFSADNARLIHFRSKSLRSMTLAGNGFITGEQDDLFVFEIDNGEDNIELRLLMQTDNLAIREKIQTVAAGADVFTVEDQGLSSDCNAIFSMKMMDDCNSIAAFFENFEKTCLPEIIDALSVFVEV